MKKFIKKYYGEKKGGAGGNLVIGVVILGVFLAGFSYTLPTTANPLHGVLAPSPTDAPGHTTLQLQTIALVTPTAIPTIPQTPPGNACENSSSNTEPGILVGFDPGPNKPINTNGTIRVWVNDERAPLIAPNEKVDPTTGQITTPGDRTAKDTNTDGNGKYLLEPAIYITQLTGTTTNGPYSGDAENGGKPYFPSIIKGTYNNSPNTSIGGFFGGGGSGTKGPAIDADYTNFENAPGGGGIIKTGGLGNFSEQYAAEYIWQVSTFGLAPGSYRAQFVIHDGDVNLAIDCFNLQI